MKTNLKFTTMIALMFTAAVGLAKEPNSGLLTDGTTKSVVTEAGSKRNKSFLKKTSKTKPVFKKKGAIIFLNLLNLEGKDVQIKVYDSNNRTLFNEVIENQSIVAKAFNFETAHKDSYTVVVKDSEKTYYEYIAVN
ncbi:hypothetical protein [uncultured Eudoraea sp.]|uniref:hypothetical protein n=1 Tax=uncultured Eudoraea sp. TaxID=1035614 RepID=UPI002606D129|nr:hypothetical protein [uncultured Eudoraea sp.]